MPTFMDATVSVREMRREVLRFLEVVRKRSACEVSYGLRGDDRYGRTWPLVVSTRPDGSDAFGVALHNASSGGLGFLCGRALPVDSEIHLQLFFHAVSPCRIPAIIRHVTPKPHALLIGCEYAFDVDEDAFQDNPRSWRVA